MTHNRDMRKPDQELRERYLSLMLSPPAFKKRMVSVEPGLGRVRVYF